MINADGTRTRTQDRRVSVSRTGYNLSLGNWTSTTSGAAGEYRTMYDRVIPKFRERMEEGEVIMSPMRSSKAVLTHGQTGSCKFQQPPGSPPPATYDSGFGNFCTGRSHSGGDWAIPGTSLSVVSAADRSSVITEACTRAASQIGRSNTDMWENLAEANKTLDLLKSPLASWFKFERKARALTAGLSAANAWLAYRYGIKPLIGSVSDVLDNLKVGTARSNRATTRASAFTQSTTTTAGSTNSTYWGVARLDYIMRLKHSFGCRAMSIDEVIGRWQYDLGFAPKSLVTLPWELLPYSFVADWAFNIGDFIGAMAQSFQPASLGQCYVTTDLILDYRTSNGTVAWAPGSVEILQSFSGWSQVETVRKERVVGLATPGIIVKQDFRFDKATRIADSFALVGQQISRAFLGRK